jgi:hypothetical protein
LVVNLQSKKTWINKQKLTTVLLKSRRNNKQREGSHFQMVPRCSKFYWIVGNANLLPFIIPWFHLCLNSCNFSQHIWRILINKKVSKIVNVDHFIIRQIQNLARVNFLDIKFYFSFVHLFQPYYHSKGLNQKIFTIQLFP